MYKTARALVLSLIFIVSLLGGVSRASVITEGVAVGSLPAASAGIYRTMEINDSTLPCVSGQTVTGGGSGKCLVHSDGVSWFYVTTAQAIGIHTQTLTETAGAATMAVTSAAIPYIDTDYVALAANITLTTPTATAMADGQEIYLIASTSGTPYTIGFSPGTSVTLKSLVPGDSGTPGAAAACGTVPSTGTAWFKWRYTSSGGLLTLISCGINPPAGGQAISAGGTGTGSAPSSAQVMIAQSSTAYAPETLSQDCTVTSSGVMTCTKTNNVSFGALATLSTSGINSLLSDLETTQSVSGATNLSPNATYQVTNDIITMTASATITLNAATVAGQTLNAYVCQNGTGGFTPTIATSGVTIVGTFPTFTTTANKCGDFSLHYNTTSTAYLSGSYAGPL